MRNDLASVQAFLASVIPGHAPIPDDPALAEAAARFVTGNGRLTPAAQVDIYRRQFWLRHREILRDDFPALARLLGDAKMDAFCRDFLDAHPPTRAPFETLIEPVPRFAEAWPGFETQAERTFAADLTRYEIALLEVRTGPDAPPLDPQKLASLPEDAWERARIVLHPAMRRLAFSYPVHRLRKAWLVSGEPAVFPDAPSPAHIALYRNRELVTHFEELEPEAFALLDLLAEGAALVPALGRLAEPLPEERQAHVAASVGRWFQQWTSLGLVVDVDLPSSS
ncbi:putative DNA-binding domain-containing protein [Polyangium sp. y55x31]|uniref:HvfC/BufC family peptide modification chaperone n=1 Tax=Polyangium sp. y55x31 TaxID=3042688 RepID=UPI002482A596|nr:putative DNA-binding domain-containing protein [Polyangium sp. y55x31]MDI1475008.1 putative DNA-binding domain-containing protein [Polyangium sp. y55x31]